MFNKLFDLLFRRKKSESVATFYEPTPKRLPRCLYDNPGSSGRGGKASQVRNSQPDDLLSNPFNPLNPIGFNSPVFYESDPGLSSPSHCDTSSSSSYDSGYSCDSGSSSSSSSD